MTLSPDTSSPSHDWCYPPRPMRVWHRFFGEGRVLAARDDSRGGNVYEVQFLWRGRKVLLESAAHLVWLDDPLGP